MRRSLLSFTLALGVPLAGCVPVLAGSLVVGGGASLYGAHLAHGNCASETGSHEKIACMWTDLMFTAPLIVLGVALAGSGAALGVHDATRE